MKTELRIACIHCDNDSADGVAEIPPGWEYVSRDTCPEQDGVWWTHTGVCPDCVKAGAT